jgi:hypothetical protein
MQLISFYGKGIFSLFYPLTQGYRVSFPRKESRDGSINSGGQKKKYAKTYFREIAFQIVHTYCFDDFRLLDAMHQSNKKTHSCGYKHKSVFVMEAPPRFELGIRVLQTHALPLGYGADWSGLRGSNSLPPPWQGGALPDELNPRKAVLKFGFSIIHIFYSFVNIQIIRKENYCFTSFMVRFFRYKKSFGEIRFMVRFIQINAFSFAFAVL